MQHIFDYILKNKEWIFSGIGIFALYPIFFFGRFLFFRRSSRTENDIGGEPSTHRQKPVKSYSIPLGLQSFSFEYGTHGHATPLTLKGTTARAEIQFTCRIVNPYQAMFGANEYALNVLRPKFLSQARGVLERFSLMKLRESRQDVASEVMAQLSPQFGELGVQLESVTIGAIEKLEDAKA